MEVVWNQGCATMLSLYYNAVFTLVLVILANGVVGKIAPRIALRRAELLLLFIMITLGTVVAVVTETLVALLVYPAYHAGQEPLWQSELVPRLANRLMVTDPRAVKAYFMGNVHTLDWGLLRPWVLPFLGWGLFMTAMTWTAVCISSLVFNQWRHQEKMSFPLTQIPLMLTEPKAQFYRSWLFWLAFALAGGINVLNALHRVYPMLPELPVKRQAFEIPGLERPWSDLSPILYSFNPLLIGLEYFLPLDLLFSIVFFFWFGRMEGVFVSYLGAEIPWSPDNMVAPYVREQAFGAILTLLVYSFMTSRGRWRESWERYRTLLAPRRAGGGILAAICVMVAILTMAGIPLPVATLMVLLFLAVTISLARIRAQYGPPSAGLMMEAPGPALVSIFGRDVLGTQALAGISAVHWLGRECGHSTLGPTVESFALAEKRIQPGRVVMLCILFGGLAGYVGAFGTALASGYHYGEATARVAGVQEYMGREAYYLFSARMQDRVHGPHLDSVLAMLLGSTLTLILQGIRSRFLGFPLHPVGYAIGSSYISTFLWSTALPVWIFKWYLLRYGGLRGYRAGAPFFLGLLLGDFMIGSAISLIGVAVGTQVYVFWPY